MSRVIASKSIFSRISALVGCLVQSYIGSACYLWLHLTLYVEHFLFISHYCDGYFSLADATPVSSSFICYMYIICCCCAVPCPMMTKLMILLLCSWLLSFSFIKFCRFQIATLATKLGVRNIAFLGSGLLLINYIGAVLAAIYLPQVNASLLT